MRTVASFQNPVDAHVALARLGGCGIQAHLRDEFTVTMYWLYSNAIGGVKVDVADDDFERACEVLAAPPLDEAGG